MKRLIPLFAAAALVVAAPASQVHAAAEVMSPASTELKLEAGKGRLIKLDRPAATVFIADPKVADVQVKSPTLVYLVGKAAGATSLFAVDGKDQMIANLGVVVSMDEGRLREMLARQAPDARIEVASVNGAVVLSGKVASAAQGDEILRTAAEFLPGDEKDKAARLINHLTVDAPNQVNLRVRIAEVSHDAAQELGFNWEALGSIGQTVLGLATGAPVVAGGAAIPNTTPNQFLTRQGGVNNIIAGLQTGRADINLMVDALAKKGLISILAEPNLTARSGEPASFLAGGEYPIPVPQQGQNQITIEYKKYGVNLAFVATVLDGGRISLNVRPEVSQLSTAGAITLNGISVPALTTRRAETTVDLGSGQSFAIAGLLQSTTTQDVSKMPGLGDVPVLGALFRSKRFEKSQSELMIIVTPYLVAPTSQKLATPADLFEPRAARAAAIPAQADAAVAPVETRNKKG